MIVQSDRKDRNETELFYENEARRIAMLNEIFENVEFSGCKAVGAAAPSVGREKPPAGRKGSF